MTETAPAATAQPRLRAAYRRHVTDRWAHWRERSDEWLRAATFGGLDGLVSNVTLLAATAATGAPASAVVTTGALNAVAGAASMGGGEYFSVSVDNERRRNLTERVRRQLRENPDGVHAELAEMLRAKDPSLSPEQARAIADKLWENPATGEHHHIAHKLEEWPEEGPSPRAAAGASFASFAAGSLLPVGAYALGAVIPGGGMATALGATAVGLFGAGALTSRFNKGCWWKLGLKQLALGGAATGLGWAAGLSLGASLPAMAAVGATAVVGIAATALVRRQLAKRRARRQRGAADEAYDAAYFEATGQLPPERPQDSGHRPQGTEPEAAAPAAATTLGPAANPSGVGMPGPPAAPKAQRRWVRPGSARTAPA